MTFLLRRFRSEYGDCFMKQEVLLLPDERLDEVNENLRLIQKTNGLTFGTDAYLLAAFVRPAPSAFAVELGGGTGIVSLLLAQTGKVRSIAALEIQKSFANLIARNAELNNLADRVFPISADLRSIAAKDLAEQPALVANPPYLPAGSGKGNRAPEKEIARHECFGDIFDFCACAGRLLGSGGRFVTVFRAERLAELYASLRENRLEPKRTIFVHADPDSSPCAVLTEAVKDAAPSLRVLPPLFLYERKPEESSGARQMTPNAEKIYASCAFPDTGI